MENELENKEITSETTGTEQPAQIETTGTETPENSGILRNEKGQFVKGHSGNPAGKPVGTISPIAKVKQIFSENPEYFQEFIEAYIKDASNRKHIVEMLDGKPRQNIGLDGGEEGLSIKFAQVFNKDADSTQRTGEDN